MSFVSWVLSFLPQWFWTLAIIVGVVGLILTWVMKLNPQIIFYRVPIQILSIIFITSGIYFHGVIDNENKWKARVKELEQKVLEKEKESIEANKKLEKEIAEKKRIQEQKNKQILEYLDKLKKKNRPQIIQGPERIVTEKIIEYIEKCPVPKEFIDIHNKAAEGAGK